LKRRNVHRAAAFHAGAAWLLVQIATQVFPSFHIPEGVVQAIVIGSFVIFPFVLVVAWIYESTLQGIKLESEIDRSASVTRQTGKAMDRWIIIVLGLAVLVLLLNQFVFHRFSTAGSADEPSIAVLPMAYSTGDPANEYFSDGVSEESINSLARLQGLKVIGRTSSFKFKDSKDDSKTIAEALQVAYLLEGSGRQQPVAAVLRPPVQGHLRDPDRDFRHRGQVAESGAARRQRTGHQHAAAVDTVQRQCRGLRGVAARQFLSRSQYCRRSPQSSRLL
jgi:hypothetical protein